MGRLAEALTSMTAAYLRLRMRELGRKYVGDGVQGLSVALWRTTQEPPKQLTDEEALELEQLSYQCGGWWELQDSEDVFVTLSEWEARYAKTL